MAAHNRAARPDGEHIPLGPDGRGQPGRLQLTPHPGRVPRLAEHERRAARPEGRPGGRRAEWQAGQAEMLVQLRLDRQGGHPVHPARAGGED